MYDEPTCRLCLSTEGLLEEIFTSPDMQERIFECTNIELRKIKGLPTCICEICKSEIIIWSKFKRQCLKTETFLKSSFPAFFNNKDEGNDFSALRDAEDSEGVENVEYIEDEFESSCEAESDEKFSEGREVQLLDVKFEAIEAEELEKELQSSDTVEVIPVEEEEDDPEVEKNSKSDEDVMRKGQKARSKSGEVWKISDGKRVKYHTRCQVCGKLQQNIKQHMLVHTNELPFKCSYCGRGFRQRSNFKHHVYIHTGEKPYKCKSCIKAFSDPASLRSHMVQHTGERRYRCEVCGKAFGHSHTLGAHRKIHTQDRRHNCNFCPKRFLSNHALKKHIRTHTGERPYHCDQCPKTFSTSGNLSTHKRVHTKERPYKCDVCGLDFAYKCVLNTHMKRHTNKFDDENLVEVYKYEINEEQC